MARTIIDLPAIFAPQLSNWELDVRGKAGQEGVTGTGQTIYGSQPRWIVDLDFVAHRTDLVLGWRSIKARLRGRQNVLRVPVLDRHRARMKDIGLTAEQIAILCNPGIPFSDESLFEEGVGFSYEPTILTTVATSAGVQTMTLDTASMNGKLTSGQYFSHDDWPYLITFESAASETPNIKTFTFEPALRRPIPAGAQIRAHATCLMVLSGDTDGRMTMNYNTFGTMAVSLTEWTGDDGDPR